MSSLILQFGLLWLVATILFAWAKGGAGERVGSTAIAVSWIASLATLALVPKADHAIVLLIFDVALATALLIVAIRYSSLWLGVAMFVQAGLLALHGQHFGEEAVPGRTFVIISNVASAIQLLAISAATCASWLKRAKGRRGADGAAAPPGMLSAA